jgi:hypothetical protein
MKKIILLILITLCLRPVFAQDVENVLKSKPVEWSGSIGVGTQFYKVSGIDPRLANPIWNISGAANVRLYGFDLPFSFTLGRQGAQSSLPTFGQIGISPRYKWLTLHGGWRSMNLSTYTLSGHTFLGGGVEMKPGKFRFSAMAGRLRRAMGPLSIKDNLPNSNNNFSDYSTPQYRRMGYALKVGVGTENNHFDLIGFRAKDEVGSLQKMDSLTPNPAENAVIGYETRFKLAKFLSFYSEGAVSAYSQNLFSDEIKAEELDKYRTVFTPRWSSKLNYAVRGGFDVSFPKAQFKIGYERIMPEFQTMGAYFFANDVENWTIAPTFRFWQSKINLAGTLGIQRNNLLNNRLATTKRLIGNAVLSANISERFGFDANYTNLAVNQANGAVRFADTIRIAMVTTNVSLTPRWTWINPQQVRAFIVSANYQQLNDRNPFTREFSDMKTWFTNAIFTQSWQETGWSWNGGVNINTTALANLNTTRYGVLFGGGKTTTDGKISANMSLTANLSQVDGSADGAVWSANGSLAWSPKPKHSFSLNLNWLRTDSKKYDDFTEFSGGLSYFYRLK